MGASKPTQLVTTKILKKPATTRKPTKLPPTTGSSSSGSSGFHKRTMSLPIKRPSSPTSTLPSTDDILAGLSLNGLSMSKRALAKSRNRALTATDFDSILRRL